MIATGGAASKAEKPPRIVFVCAPNESLKAKLELFADVD
jgi:hypothetical protein